MRGKTSLLVILLAFAASVTINGFAVNSTVGLCAGPGTHYTTIGDAVTHAASGSIVEVCPGTYPEQVVITKGLTLEGVKSATGAAPTIVSPSGGLLQNGTEVYGYPLAAQIYVNSTGGSVNIKDLTVDGTGNSASGCGLDIVGIYYLNTSGAIENNAVRNQYATDFAGLGGCQIGLAIEVEGSASSTPVTISGNSVHAFQKVGIVASGAVAATISGNSVVGLGSTALNWISSAPAAEVGIQVGYGATGSVTSNDVMDVVWENDTDADTSDAAGGILVFSSGVKVSSNIVASSQFGISAITYSGYGAADNTTITSNRVLGTQIFDAIDICSNNNTVKANYVADGTESGIHIDDSCTGNSNGNTVQGNTINEACAGILLGSGSGNTLATNTFLNVGTLTMSGDTCFTLENMDAKGVVGSKAHRKLRPSPYGMAGKN